MIVEQIYTGCLAQGAYYVESEGEALVIDPLREPTPYLERAAKNGAKIRYVLETHFHADFVSGHVDLAKQTGATIIYGPLANPGFEAHVATDGEEIKLGKVTIKVLHTPGHTMESTTYLLRDESGKDYAIFTGDTLFIGDVGRPDLAQKGADLTVDDLAGHLFDSLRNKIMPLDNEVIVYPGHGAGSACGKNMSSETVSTVGNQKDFNYALRANMTREEFIREVTDGLTTPPQYFPKNVAMNKGEIDSYEEIMDRGMKGLSPEEFELVAESEEALILDTRDKDVFAQEFIPNSIFIGLDGNFAPWVGALIPDIKQNILIVAEEGREEEAVRRLARVGYDHCLGFLKGGVKAWKAAGKKVDQIQEVSADELASLYHTDLGGRQIVDVRKESEYSAEHVDGAINVELDYINEQMASLDPAKSYFMHCVSGYRSLIANSILRARGFDKIINVAGGMKALTNTSIPLTDFVCPSTIKK